MNRTRTLVTALGGLVLLILVLFFAVGGGHGLKKQIFAQAIPTDYFEPYVALPPAFERISESVHAFQFGFNRALILDTPEGLAVFDTFNNAYAAALKAELAARFPGKPIRWVIYSHNHLDHIRGSQVFAEAEIIGHKDVNHLIADWPYADDIRPVTRPLDGDATLRLGGVEVEFLFMPNSHSQTLYGFHIPSQSAVFAPDMMFVRALPPFDFPDFYFPGYLRALDRLIALEAEHYVPSHMERGSLQDLIDYRNMAADFEATARKHLAEIGYEAADGKAMRAALKASYDELAAEYGDWHGFDAMFVPKFGRHWGGTYLGY